MKDASGLLYNQVALFIRVIDAGGFSKASRVYKIPKSRLSRNISSLESELGYPIIYRNTREISLTEEGQKLYELSKHSIYELDSHLNSISKDRKELSGTLKITAPTNIGDELLSPIICDLKSMHPKIKINLNLSDQKMDLIKHRIDVAIRIDNLTDSTMKIRKIGFLKMILVASGSYLLNNQKINDLSDLKDHKILSFIYDKGKTSQLKLITPQNETQQIIVNSDFESTSLRLLTDLAIAGKGIAFIPEYLCKKEIHDGSLIQVLPGYHSEPLQVQVVWPNNSQINSKVRAFVDLTVKHLSPWFSNNMMTLKQKGNS